MSTPAGAPAPAASGRPRATPRSLPLVPWVVELHGVGQVGGALLRALDADRIPVAAVHRRGSTELRPVAGQRCIVVDATPPRLSGPEADEWVAFLEATLRGGSPVVTCNKAPLAQAWSRLRDAALAGGVPLVATATVGGGTPVLPTLRALAAERPIARIEATLSGTLGVVLPRVKAGASVAQAVAEAQAAGFCEPDPRIDLDGVDAWAKACILHNALWPEEPPVLLGDQPGPLRWAEADVQALASPAVVARIGAEGVRLGLEDWPAGRALEGIQVRAHAAGGVVTLSGAGAGPDATAAALLDDVKAVLSGRLAPGIH